MKSTITLNLVWILFFLAIVQSCTDKSGENRTIEEPGETSELYSMSDFAKLRKIDTHAHIGSIGKTMIRQARENNFRLMVMAVDVPEYPPVPEQREICIKHRAEDPDVFAYTTAFTLEGWDEPGWHNRVIEQLKIDFDNGALGVKVWKNIGMVERDKNGAMIMLDHENFDPVFEFIRDQGKILLSHAGEPKNCWLPLEEMTVNNDRNYFSNNPEYHMYLHPELPSYEDQITARDNMLSKHPEMVFIGVHLASLEWDVDQIANFLDKFSNASVDLTHRIPHLQYQSLSNPDKVRGFFIKYQDRITYGTDFEQLEDHDPEGLKESMLNTWMSHWRFFNTNELMKVEELDQEVRGLALPKPVVDKVYRINAERIFKDAWDEKGSES